MPNCIIRYESGNPIVSVKGYWTYPASVDTSPSRSVFFYQSNLLELGRAQVS
jgi:hypothetical protein